jgi:predicted site-specific integrase-resolvase
VTTAPTLLTPAAVARLAGVARSTVTRAISTGALPVVFLATGGMGVRPADAEAWAALPHRPGRPRKPTSPP